jgi:hypothetical protein
MSDLIQIAPGVLFSTAVLKEEWGSEHLQNRAKSQASGGATTAKRQVTAIAGGEDSAREVDPRQIDLL